MMEGPVRDGSRHVERESGMATLLVGPVFWKVRCAVTAGGTAVSWTILGRKPRRVQLGFVMGVVKEDFPPIDWDWKGMMKIPPDSMSPGGGTR